MDLFDLPEKEFEKALNEIFEKQSKEELLSELIDCGLILSKDSEGVV